MSERNQNYSKGASCEMINFEGGLKFIRLIYTEEWLVQDFHSASFYIGYISGTSKIYRTLNSQVCEKILGRQSDFVSGPGVENNRYCTGSRRT